MEIYKVTTCKFTSSELGGLVPRLRLVYENYVEHFCEIDFKNSIAIDIFTGEKFYILKKDDNNRILESEGKKIVMNQDYVIETQKLNLKSLTKRERNILVLAYLKFKLLELAKPKKTSHTKTNVIKR